MKDNCVQQPLTHLIGDILNQIFMVNKNESYKK